jgi:mannitol/fructose-specific phosphotransferase system IIA component (Ntr-type)
VRVILLFAVRETGSTDAHLKTLANLSRKLMDEDFRARLEKETDPKALCALLGEAVGGGSQMPNAKV